MLGLGLGLFLTFKAKAKMFGIGLALKTWLSTDCPLLSIVPYGLVEVFVGLGRQVKRKGLTLLTFTILQCSLCFYVVSEDVKVIV